jgi:hypothetical protein
VNGNRCIAFLLIGQIVLGGCAALIDTPESRSAQLAGWARLYSKQAEAGERKWSDYYKGLYAHFYFIPELPGYDLYLRWSIAQLEAALAAESGKISQEDFASFQRKMNAAMGAFAVGGRQKSAEQIASLDRDLLPLENQALKWYGRAVICVADGFNRVYTAKCQ